MEPLKRVRSKTVVIASSNIDTDQIIPARFLTTTTKEGLGNQLFADWRYLSDGSPNPEFVLNGPEASGCKVLVAGRNFGCGSSREQAAACLRTKGLAAVVAVSFGRIFYRNAINQGLPAIICPEAADAVGPGDWVRLDLEAGRIELPAGTFPFAPFPPNVQALLDAGGLVPLLRFKVPDRGPGVSEGGR